MNTLYKDIVFALILVVVGAILIYGSKGLTYSNSLAVFSGFGAILFRLGFKNYRDVPSIVLNRLFIVTAIFLWSFAIYYGYTKSWQSFFWGFAFLSLIVTIKAFHRIFMGYSGAKMAI